MIKAEPITARELEKRQSRKRLLGCSLRWCCLLAVAAYLIAFVWSWNQWGYVPNPVSPVFDVIDAAYGYAYRVGWIKLDYGPATCDSIELVEYDNQPVISYKTNIIGNQLRFAFLDSNIEESPETWQATNVLGDASFSWVETPQLAYINNGKPGIGYCLDGRNTYFFTARTALPGQPADWPNPEYLYGSNHVDGPMFIDLMDYQGKPAFAGAYTWESYPSPATGNPAQMQQTYVQHLIYGRARTANSANSEDWLCLDFKVATGRNQPNLHDIAIGTADGLPVIVTGSSQGVTFTAAQVAEPDFAAQFDRHTVIAGADARYVSYLLLGDRPVIGFIDGFLNELQVSIARVAMPSQATDWDTHTVTSGQVLRSLSLAVDDGRLAAAVQVETMAAPTHQNDWRGNYIDNGNGAYDLVYACALKDIPSATIDWQLVTVDGGDSTGFFCDLAEVDGYPAIAYYDVSEEALKLAWATAVQPATAADWDIQTVDDLAALEPIGE